MELSLVVPAHNGGDDLSKCLEAIKSSNRQPDQVVVVDDGSTDNSVRIEAQKHGYHYILVPNGPAGPANARNLGLESTNADVVLFIDSDVVITPDTIGQVEKQFVDHPETDALFGSYDTTPKVNTIVSRYKNLLHHFVHQHGETNATTFWSGCGAVKRQAYIDVGGFDVSYGQPSIEDIEFGLRLTEAGYNIKLCPHIQVKHLKHWTFTGMIRTDIFGRAVPWTKLMIERDEGVTNDLNTRKEHRLSALICLLLVLCVLGTFIGYNLIYPMVFLLGAFLVLDRKLFAFFYRTGGFKLALGSAALHFLYYLYASTTFVIINISEFLRKIFLRRTTFNAHAKK